MAAPAAEAATEVLGKVAAPVAQAAAGAVSKKFRTGNKKVFLPAQGITFVHSKDPNPNFARFQVPLRFNKFDLRDYLLHVYRTPVLAVRSAVYRQPPKDKMRPYELAPHIKVMTVELAQPFVFPKPPADDTPWVSEMRRNANNAYDADEKYMEESSKKALAKLRDERPEPFGRKNLRNEAKRLLREGGWSNKRELDPRWTETKKW